MLVDKIVIDHHKKTALGKHQRRFFYVRNL